MTTLLQLNVKSSRDVLLARVRARQIAKLLGFDETEQTKIACVVFELVWREWQEKESLAARFEVQENLLQLVTEYSDETGKRAQRLQIAKPLPRAQHMLSEEDWPWVILHLRSQPVHLFEEVRRLNHELLNFFLERGQGQKSFAQQKNTSQPVRAA
jgi:hypothetical protein